MYTDKKKDDYCIKIISNNDMYKDILKSRVISLISFSLVFSLLFCLVGIDQRLKRHKIIIIVSFFTLFIPHIIDLILGYTYTGIIFTGHKTWPSSVAEEETIHHEFKK